jgi:hypothetical protein
MNCYSIIADGLGGYQVVVSRKDGGPGLTTTAFPTWTKARDWIDEQRREQTSATARGSGPRAE